jgi:L-lactate dehydrogenase complex protein LldF
VVRVARASPGPEPAGIDARALELAEPALHDARVFAYREKRDRAAASEPDFDALRRHAAAVKAHVLGRLAPLLEQFEAAARNAGAVVHWAEDAGELVRAVHGLLAARGVRRVVKSKSMLTEECGLNPYLEARGIEVIDTDLGERIVQLAGEPPSHIIFPAIHKSAAQIGELFERRMDGPRGERDPTRLTHHARAQLRRRFLEAEAGISGVNFAVAESGSIAICTNEGNADLGTSLPPVHIACLGIEKLVPTLADLAVFLRLLARSATGQPITTYTSLITGPAPGRELHLVLVDNGRSRLLARPEHRATLACIRCGACLNTCPVYRRAGGHAYGLSVPGPIGLVLSPALEGSKETAALSFASSLCGSCSHVCPVGIDLHDQLYAWRSQVRPGLARRLGMRAAAALLARPVLYRVAGRVLRSLWPLLARRWRGNPASAWLASRELPPHPGASFARRWRHEARR